MPRTAKPKKLTQEELFPHSGFPYRLETKEDDGTKKGTTRIAWFQCEWHLTKHVDRYKITEGVIDVQDGHTLEVDPLKPKPKRKPRAKATTKKVTKAPAKPKAKTTAKKPSATKASRKTTTKKPAKPAAKTTRTKRATKTAKKEVFSTMETFFE